MSQPVKPTVPSIITVELSDLNIRKNCAVPVATAVPLATDPNVIVPFESVPKDPVTVRETNKV